MNNDLQSFDADVITAELKYAFDGVFSDAEVAEAVESARALLEPRATVQTFLPVLVKRHATELLASAAQADGRTPNTVPELLFVCVHNAGRSQMAAALAAHLAPGRVHVRSAGSNPTGAVNQLAIEVLAERGIELKDPYPKPLSDSFLHAADVIITMGCGDTCPVFPGKRYLDWEVDDPDGKTIEQVRDIRDDLQARVSALLRDLNI